MIVAQCLRDNPDADSALTTFERTRRERVEKVVAHGNHGSNTKAPGPLGRTVRDAALPLIFRHLEASARAGPAGGPVGS